MIAMLSAIVGVFPLRLRVETATVGLATIALYSLLAWKIYYGRNWARWLFFAVFVYAVLDFGLELMDGRAQIYSRLPMLVVIIGVIQHLINLAVLVLLLMGPSRAWFRNERPSPKT